MPIPPQYLANFEENGIYHVFNRTNNKELLFLNDDNRRYFLKQYKTFLSPYAHTFCWCLLWNHFHFLIRIKDTSEITAFVKQKPLKELSVIDKKFLEKNITTGEMVEQAFKRFFQSYALAFNKMHNRQGNLFYKPFKRVCIEKESQFTMAIVYIHANPAKHKLVNDFTRYEWSSWQSYFSEKPSMLARDEIIQWFGNMEQFKKAHTELAENYYNCKIAIED